MYIWKTTGKNISCSNHNDNDSKNNYTNEEIQGMSMWLDEKKKIDTDTIRINQTSPDTLNYEQSLVYNMIINHCKKHKIEPSLTVLTGGAGFGKMYHINFLQSTQWSSCIIPAYFDTVVIQYQSRKIIFIIAISYQRWK